MDKNFIKVLIEEGRPIVDVPQEEALTKLNNDIMTVYVMNGLHRSMAPDAFKEEVRTCAVALYQELTTDPSYRMLRDREIPYIFSNGMKGRLGTDKDIGLTYKNLIRWVEGYIKHQERRDALSMYIDENKPKPPQLPPHETTEEDFKRWVNDAWSDWCEFKGAQEKRIRDIEDGKIRPGHGQFQSIGDVFKVPITCYDYGGLKIEYLRKVGLAKQDEKLSDVFRRVWDGGKRGGSFV